MPGAGNPQAFNRYAYALNSPLTYIDPSGHVHCVPGSGGQCDDWAGGVGSGEMAAQAALALLTLMSDVADTVVSAKQCADGDNFACAAMALPFITGPMVKARARVLGLVDNVPVGAADEVVESLTDVGKSDIASELSKGLPQQQQIAQAINDGKIGVNILDDESFGRQARSFGWKGELDDLKGIASRDQIYLRKSSANIYSDAAHEGTHALDYLDGFRGSNYSWEKRAYYYERQFQIYTGRELDFETLPGMLRHIYGAY